MDTTDIKDKGTTEGNLRPDGSKKIVLSGIRSTGNLHLGNYYGALQKFVKMQDDYDTRYFIADLHALTTNPDPKALHESVKQILAEYIAAGLDPKRTFFTCKAMSRRYRKCICCSTCMSESEN